MTPKRTETHDRPPLSATDFHVLLALVDGALYGYAIKKAVEAQSEGRVAPEIGSLYRILARLTGTGLVEEAPSPDEGSPVHPGRDRKYYRLTEHGRARGRSEAERLRDVLRLSPARALLLQREGR
jgi:DNA-binding PadR family transcriptional regulator